MADTAAPAPICWTAAVRYLRRGPALNVWTADAATAEEATAIIIERVELCGIGPARVEHIEPTR